MKPKLKPAPRAPHHLDPVGTAADRQQAEIAHREMENREAHEQDRVAAVVERRQRHLIKGSNARAMAAPATELFTTLIIAAVFVYAGRRATAGAGMLGGA